MKIRRNLKDFIKKEVFSYKKYKHYYKRLSHWERKVFLKRIADGVTFNRYSFKKEIKCLKKEIKKSIKDIRDNFKF